jgi:phosphatidate cytidylyltransferase
MNDATWSRLFDWSQAFAHPVTQWIVLLLVVLLAISAGLIFVLRAVGKTSDALHRELVHRYLSWLVLVPMIVVPILAGAAWTILAVGILSVACYREFAATTPLKDEKLINAIVFVSIVALTLAVADHWYGFYMALFPLTVCMIAAVAIFPDRPAGYVQRVALGTFGYAMFGAALSHLGYMANDANYRPILLLIFLAVELNDIFAFICGKTFGHRKLAPNTSPGKTLGGSLGALVLTTALFATIAHFVFAGTAIDHPLRLIALGAIVSILGQLGDLMLSSVKRDLGIKDMGQTIPGHGGLLDRFDSLILVAPAVFHFVGYYVGFGLDQQTRILF